LVLGLAIIGRCEMAVTRTHTYYWGEDDLAPLLAEAAALRADMEDRMMYLPTEFKTAMLDRINNLDIAIRLMGDVAQ
jgi:hypothetical protein